MKDTSIPKPQCTIVFYGPNGPLELVSWPSSECFIGWGGDSWVAVITWLNGGEPLFKRSYTNQQITNEGSIDVPQLFEHQQQQACLSMDNDSFSLIQNLF